jgi:hypothetical protein
MAKADYLVKRGYAAPDGTQRKRETVIQLDPKKDTDEYEFAFENGCLKKISKEEVEERKTTKIKPKIV